MINSVVLVGRLTADPELRSTPSGVPVCTVRLALDRRPDKDGGRQTDFVTVVAWRGSAEFLAHYFGRGDPVGVVGELRSRSYDAADGVRRHVVEVVAERVAFTANKRASVSSSPPSEGLSGFVELPVDDDLPFDVA